MDGFIMGALLFAVSQGVQAIAKVASAKLKPSIKAADTVKAQATTIGGEKNLLKNINYTDKVKVQMSNSMDLNHSFPSMIDDIAGTQGKVGNFVGGDGIARTAIELPGAINGKEGLYQYIIESNGVTVNHREFVSVLRTLLGGK